MAGLLHLRISGFDEERLRQWRIRSSEASAWGAVAKLTVLGVVLSYLPNLMQQSQESSVQVAGQVVTGNTVVLVLDRSGSMNQRMDIVQERLALLRAGGIDSEVACELGNNEFPDFIQCLDRLVSGANADGVYVLSDFNWSYDGDRLNRARRVFATQRLRLYLETIGVAPHSELLRLAEDSGGGATRPGQ
jgi:hypothetical protein